MPVKVGGVILDIQTNVARVANDFDKIKGNLNKFTRDAKKILGSIGISLGAAFAVRSIKNFIVEGVKTIDALQDMSQGAGMATKAFQGLLHMASYAGVEQGRVSQSVKRLNQNILDANRGLIESKRSFHDLGIEYQTQTGQMRDTESVLRDIMDRFSGMDDTGKKAALASKLLGKSGADLIPVLSQNSKELDKVIARLQRMGALVDDETMEAIDRVNQNFKDMGAALRGIKLQIMKGMADELRDITDVAVKNADAFRIFEKLGDWFGKLSKHIITTAAGFAGFMDLWGSFIGMSAAQLAEGPLKLFDTESNKMMAEDLSKIAEKWGRIIQDIRQGSGGSGAKKKTGGGDDDESPVNMLEKESALIKRIMNEQKSKWTQLNEEKSTLENIQKYIIAQKERTTEQVDIYYAMTRRIQEITAEMKKMATADVWGNMKIGAKEYYDSILDRSKQIREATINGFKNMEDALVEFVTTGKMQWRALADSIIADIARILIRQRLIMPIMGGLGLGADAAAGPTAGPVATSGAKRGRTLTGASVNLSNNLTQITTQNTSIMQRQVDDFVKQSERQFDRLGQSLRRNLSLSGSAGLTTGTPSSNIIGGGGGGGVTGGGAIPGGSTSGIAVSGGGIPTGPVGTIAKAVGDPSLGNIANALIENNIITQSTKGVVNAVKSIGKGIKKVFKWHGGGTIGDFPPLLSQIPQYHNGLAPDERIGIFQKGEEIIPRSQAGQRGVTINIPITMAESNPSLASRLKEQIEKTVLDVMRQYA